MSIETLRTFLGWSALLNLVWLTFLFFVFMLGKEWIYRLHSHWFSLSREAMDSILYAAMAWYPPSPALETDRPQHPSPKKICSRR